MTTLKQCLRFKTKRIKKAKKKRCSIILNNAPQKKGSCLEFFRAVKPRKPNSAKRKVAQLRLTTGFIIRAQIPGQNADLSVFKAVLVRGGRVRDLPGIRFRVIRGVLGSSPVLGRITSRSKYGVKRKINSNT